MSYLRISQVILKNSVARFTEFRSNALLHIFVSFLWIGLRFIFVDTIFSYTTEIGGWSKNMVWPLILFFPCIDSFSQALFSTLTWGLHENIVNGELDGTFIKPKSTLFLTSFIRFDLQPFITGLLQVAVFAWALVHAVPEISFFQIMLGCSMAVCAIIIQFSISLIVGCIGFWFPKTENLLDTWYEILGVASYPLTALPNTLHQIFLTILPVAFMAFVPVSAFLGVLSGKVFLLAIVVTGVFLSVAVGLWHVAIKKYSSASS